MKINGNICVRRLVAKSNFVLLLSVWGFFGVMLQTPEASATTALGVIASMFAASKEVPADLIIAVSIFVAVFVLRMGRISRRHPVKQERPRSERDQF